MPIDNDYFKKKQQGFGGGYQPPFEPPEFFSKFSKLGKFSWVLYSLIVVIFLLFIARPFVVINSGEVGIIATTGKYDPVPLRPGFHLYIPFIQKVFVVDTKVRLINYKKVEDLGEFNSGIKMNQAINILDSRGLPVSIEMTVQYQLRPDGAPMTIANWGLNWEDKIVNPVVRDVVRSVIGKYAAEQLPTKRNEIATLIEQGIRKQIESLPQNPVKLLSVQLREIGLPKKIKEQIERVQIANQEAQRAKYEVQRAKQEAEKRAALAKGLADAKRIEAQGRADAVMIEAKSQAKANELISKSLTMELLQLEQIKVQGKFNEALKDNKDAKIFLTPGGSTPNIWVDLKNSEKYRTSSKDK